MAKKVVSYQDPSVDYTRYNMKQFAESYQPKLTPHLDDYDDDFNASIVNEIILWKVNRYAELSITTMNLLNSISRYDTELDPILTAKVLTALLETKGIRLPMASTFLRFKNPNLYQIIDQRVYRFVYKGNTVKYPTKVSDQVSFYLQYLEHLRRACCDVDVPFCEADLIFYMADKHMNAGINIVY